MADIDTSAAKAAVNEFLDAQTSFGEASEAFKEATKRYKAACADAAKKCEGVTFKGKNDVLYFFSKVRGGGYALKPRQERWSSEGLTVVNVGNRL
jgi:hypothetical protein